MDLSSLSILTSILLLLPLFNRVSYCQQPYVDDEQWLNCSSTLPQLKGYLCNGPQTQYQSFLTFRSTSVYNSPLTIASLLNSDASDIATINNIKSTAEGIPYGNLVIVPVPCHCTGTIYSHQASYSVVKDDTYFNLANITFQGLIFCRALIDQNYYYGEDLAIDAQLQSSFCYCPNGYTEGAPRNGLNCMADQKKFPFKLVLAIGAGIGMGVLSLSLFSYCLYRYLRKQRDRIVKEKLFKQNGGLLLQQKFSRYGRDGKAAIFSEEDLQRATDNYSQSRILGQGGFGTVYKGMLPDGTIVAVKKSKAINTGQIKQFINEVVVLSQVNHRNIVKLIGCCLETELPLLVYEFIPNGTLSQHIHQQDKDRSLSWEDRYRIACEVAGAVAYMHSAASIPIYHRDIKPSNILLDDNYTAKVSDFGTSRPVPSDKTHLTTAVQGTFGYLDPEYFQSSHFTDKSDVYSFGVVLVELLTGQKPTSFSGDDEGRHLVANFILLMKENSLSEILDPVVANEAKAEDVLAVATLAMRCLRLNGRKRPPMREVVMELEGLRKSQSFSQTSQSPCVFEDGLPGDAIEESIDTTSMSLKIESISL
ncbi:hypothetical protein EUGRSUZ_L03402 [Eucalyptus grandis]|uniref:Protein kinase domain-containing protein n=1 Tax=Eucalyptus grandis TaxID=71139 RepID=A0AAD9T7K5_EUCGR|nr:hypothetical protein EUGRSUZ_L03402 [Eucalyptus grandis]